MARVFVVDDDMTMVQSVSELLLEQGHEVVPFHNGPEAIEALECNAPDLIITDLFLQRAYPQGLELLQKARSLNPPSVVIIITGYASVETAVQAMKRGAYDYLEKPFKPDDFVLCVKRALSYNKAISENIFLRRQLREKYQFDQIIGNSNKMQCIYKLMERIANTDSNILILGESGTGKELIARALHFNSRRQFAPFIPVNCSALPENLLESELFGHCKGAFIDAIVDKKGLFQEAEGGTVFLDEVGSMPSMLQSRLLRFLQDKKVRRIGEKNLVHVNVRVLAATNESLEKRISEGAFREDLYYRLSVIPLQLPPLRERKEDIPLLVAHFLKNKYDEKTGHPISIGRHALKLLESHDWPGNVRELENVIERGAALCENRVIRISDLPPSLQSYAAKQSLMGDKKHFEEADLILGTADLCSKTKAELESFYATLNDEHSTSKILGPLREFMRLQEMRYLRRAITLHGNDKEKAASALGISLATLYRKISEPTCA